MNRLQPAQCRLASCGLRPAPVRVCWEPQWGQGDEVSSEIEGFRTFQLGGELVKVCDKMLMLANPKNYWNSLAISRFLIFY